MIKEYRESFYTNKFDDLGKMNQFLKKHKLLNSSNMKEMTLITP